MSNEEERQRVKEALEQGRTSQTEHMTAAEIEKRFDVHIHVGNEDKSLMGMMVPIPPLPSIDSLMKAGQDYMIYSGRHGMDSLNIAMADEWGRLSSKGYTVFPVNKLEARKKELMIDLGVLPPLSNTDEKLKEMFDLYTGAMIHTSVGLPGPIKEIPSQVSVMTESMRMQEMYERHQQKIESLLDKYLIEEMKDFAAGGFTGEPIMEIEPEWEMDIASGAIRESDMVEDEMGNRFHVQGGKMRHVTDRPLAKEPTPKGKVWVLSSVMSESSIRPGKGIMDQIRESGNSVIYSSKLTKKDIEDAISKAFAEIPELMGMIIQSPRRFGKSYMSDQAIAMGMTMISPDKHTIVNPSLPYPGDGPGAKEPLEIKDFKVTLDSKWWSPKQIFEEIGSWGKPSKSENPEFDI